MKSKLYALILSGLIFSSVFVSGCLSPAESRDDFDVISFSSEKELEKYMADLNENGGAVYAGARIAGAGVNAKASLEMSADSAMPMPAPTVSPTASDGGRHSGTNVRTATVDEADVIKTDGQYIYYASSNYYYVADASGKHTSVRKTYIIDALPPETAAIVGAIEGDMYVSGLYLLNDSLILIGNDELKCYDIADPEKPRLSWSEKTDGYYKDSRLADDVLYLITYEYDTAYPIVYRDAVLPAKAVYVPKVPSFVSNDASITYFVSKIDLSDGSAADTIAVLGNWDMTIYVSGTHAYLSTHYMPNERAVMTDFIAEEGGRFYPDDVMSKIKRVLNNDDFGENAKYLEIDETIETYMRTLSPDEQEALSVSAQEAFSEYYSAVLWENERTVISRLDLETFELTTGTMPGAVLNDYSMDEYDGCLRAASTIGDNWYTRNESENAVFIFDESMDLVGELRDIAEGERIYSAVFTGDIMYMVTFRETDPFFVVDLSDPASPSVLGELKIPGYSSYLHPIGNDLVIGVGRIDGSTKISLFSTADLANPIELDTYTFDEYSSAVYDFHAFLWDGETNTLVIPASNHAYILNVDDAGISLKLDDVHNSSWVSRTLYINDCLYTVSDRYVHVIDMNTWDVLNIIDIPESVWPDIIKV